MRVVDFVSGSIGLCARWIMLWYCCNTNSRYVTQITTLQSSWSHRERPGERQGACQIGNADRRRHTYSGHHEGSRSGTLFFVRSISSCVPPLLLVFAMVNCRGTVILMHSTKCQNASRNTEFPRCRCLQAQILFAYGQLRMLRIAISAVGPSCSFASDL